MAANQGYAKAQHELGEMYLYYDHRGVKKDENEALRWFRMAANQGYAEAQCQLGHMYRLGEGVQEDESEAMRWYETAANQGYAEAQCQLGHMYSRGETVQKDNEAERSRIKQDVYLLGVNHLETMVNRPADVDYQTRGEALRWYVMAADQGHNGAESHLYSLFDKLGGVQEAARRGFAIAQFYWGHHLLNNDEMEALRWYEMAANQGYAKAQDYCGYLCRPLRLTRGIGNRSHREVVQEDGREALRWYKMAADQGYAKAQHELGNMYRMGEGEDIPMDRREALRWYEMAANQGYAKAQDYLGYIYENGYIHANGDVIVPKDRIKAYAWYNLAVENEFSSQHSLDLLQEKMESNEVISAIQYKYNLKAKNRYLVSGKDYETSFTDAF